MIGMSSHVQRQMVRSAKRSIAEMACERSNAGVLPKVASQLIGSGESPHASVPGTNVGLFTCKIINHSIKTASTDLAPLFTGVRPLVRFKVRAFRINFITTFDITLVDLLAPIHLLVLVGRFIGRALGDDNWGGNACVGGGGFSFLMSTEIGSFSVVWLLLSDWIGSVGRPKARRLTHPLARLHNKRL